MGRLAILLAAHALIFLALASQADARRTFVPRQVRTIQAAIDAAADGDTIWVASGTYPGPLVLKKRLVLFGDGGPDSTILDGGDSVRVLHIEGVRGGAVVGFGIRRGKSNAGGGIHCVRDTSLMIASCLFEKNWEGALWAFESTDINLNESRFVENEGSALLLTSSGAIIRSCAFVRNRGYAGAAISFERSGSMFPVRNCTFEENRAEGATGGAVNAAASDVVLAECLFRGNSAKVAGGAVAAMDSSRVAVSRCTFLENHAGGSGAIHSDRATVRVALSTFDRNRAAALGAAVGLVGRGVANVNPLFQNNTFYKNSAVNEGVTVWTERVSPEFRRNIFVVESGQRVARGISSSPLFECNLVHDPSGAAVAALPSGDTLFGDPMFCDAGNGDFTLRDLSPAVLAPCGHIGALPKKCASFQLVPSR